MKKMDEMDRNIYLRSVEWAYRAAMLALAAWTFYGCYQTLAHGVPHRPLPGLILCLAATVQGFAQMALKQRMTSGDEEYRPPNRLLQTLLASILIAVLILFLGTFLILHSRA